MDEEVVKNNAVVSIMMQLMIQEQPPLPQPKEEMLKHLFPEPLAQFLYPMEVEIPHRQMLLCVELRQMLAVHHIQEVKESANLSVKKVDAKNVKQDVNHANANVDANYIIKLLKLYNYLFSDRLSTRILFSVNVFILRLLSFNSLFTLFLFLAKLSDKS